PQFPLDSRRYGYQRPTSKLIPLAFEAGIVAAQPPRPGGTDCAEIVNTKCCGTVFGRSGEPLFLHLRSIGTGSNCDDGERCRGENGSAIFANWARFAVVCPRGANR